MLKSILQKVLRSNGWELCRYSESEVSDAKSLGLDIGSLNYKEFQVAKAIASGGHITLDEARFLGELVRSTDPADTIIEIGTLFGYSTLVLAMNKFKTQQLITVDSYVWNPLGISSQAHAMATKARLADLRKHDAVNIVHQDKDVFFRDYRGSEPGLFFCDADHDYEPTLRDLQWAKKIGSKIICGHDYDPVHFPGVVQAVQELGGPRKLVGTLFVL